MIFITGDCHGDYRRFSTAIFPEQKTMTKEDYVIILGDFGLWKDDKEQRYWLKWLDGKPFTTLWIDGNHENYDLLSTYPKEMWHGGMIQKIMPSIYHLCRGEVFDIEGKTFFCFGGASSHDISGGILEADDPLLKQKEKVLKRQRASYRINHISWWKEELPSEDEYENGLKNLKKYDFRVNYILTHCTSISIQDLLSDGLYKKDALTDYLEMIKNKVTYYHWFFGHYHINRNITNKDHVLYEQIIQIK